MKAIVYKKYGPPEVLNTADVPKPAPKDNEVRIKVRAVEATKADCELRSFNLPVKWFWLPLRIAFGITAPRKNILGAYFAGVIESTGKSVKRLKIGDEVFGSAGIRMAAYAEYLCLPDSYTIVSKPRNLTFEEAAAVPLGGLNALHFMRKAEVQKGDKVLVNGAGGSIGTFAVQIAKSMGAEVTAVDSAIKEDMLRRIGADHFVDYATENFTETGNKYDVILDMVAKSSFSACVRSLNSNGRYLMGNPRISDMLKAILTTKFSDKKASFAFAGETKEELLELRDMIESGKIMPAVDKVYRMDEAPEAHLRVETEQRLGIVVISISEIERGRVVEEKE